MPPQTSHILYGKCDFSVRIYGLKQEGGWIIYKRFSKAFEGLMKLNEEIQKRNQVSQEHNLF